MADAITFLKVAAVFVAVVVAMKKKAPMGLALSAGGIAIALLMQKSPAWIGTTLAGGWSAVLFSAKTVQFVAVMGMIVGLSYVLDRAKQIDRLTAAFLTCSRNPRMTMATLPAIIGLLPMPGGAHFSAPMVEKSAEGTGLNNHDMALINYWYRHVWEYSWPLYPGVYLGAQLMHVDTRVVALWQAPLCLAAIVGGWLFVRRAAKPATENGGSRRRAAGDALIALSPFLLIFVLHLVAGLDLLISVGAGLVYTCLWVLAARRIGVGLLGKTLFANWGVLDMMLMGYGAAIFGSMMVESGAIAGISSLFQKMNLPVLALAVALPMAVGFFAGMTIVFVMTTFPILLAYPGVAEAPLGVMILAFASGYCGTLMSPVHSCLVMSVRYFKSDVMKPMLRMAVPCLIILATGAGLTAAYRGFERGQRERSREAGAGSPLQVHPR